MNFIRIAVLLSTMILADGSVLPNALTNCPNADWEYANYCYYVTGSTTTWRDAIEMCQTRDPNADLLVLHSEEERNEVTSALGSFATSEFVWLGCWKEETSLAYYCIGEPREDVYFYSNSNQSGLWAFYQDISFVSTTLELCLTMSSEFDWWIPIVCEGVYLNAVCKSPVQATSPSPSATLLPEIITNMETTEYTHQDVSQEPVMKSSSLESDLRKTDTSTLSHRPMTSPYDSSPTVGSETMTSVNPPSTNPVEPFTLLVETSTVPMQPLTSAYDSTPPTEYEVMSSVTLDAPSTNQGAHFPRVTSSEESTTSSQKPSLSYSTPNIPLFSTLRSKRKTDVSSTVQPSTALSRDTSAGEDRNLTHNHDAVSLNSNCSYQPIPRRVRNTTTVTYRLITLRELTNESETNGSFGNDDNWCIMKRPLLVYQSTSVMSCALYCASQPIKCSTFCVKINEEGFQCQIYGNDFDIDDRITELRNRQSSGLSLLYIT